MQRLNEHLEEKVAERTAALQAEIEERQRAEEALQKARDELDMRVQARTAELAHANQELRRKSLSASGLRRRCGKARRACGRSWITWSMVFSRSTNAASSSHTILPQSGSWLHTRRYHRAAREDVRPRSHHGEHDSALSNALRPDNAKRIDIGQEVTGRRKDSSTFPLELAVSEMRLGHRRMFTAVTRDITQRKEVDRLKDELISTVSHELRAPMTSLRGFAELMLNREFHWRNNASFDYYPQ